MEPWKTNPTRRLLGPWGLALCTAAGVLALSSVGLGDDNARWLGPVSVVMLLLSQGGLALAYVLGAFGLGRPVVALLAPSSTSRLWLQLALGLALMLSLSHLLGVLGLLSGQGVRPRAVGIGVVGLGLVLLLDQLVRGPLRPERWPVLPRSIILWAPALAILLTAASNAPGWLWSSEFGAYDVLSYHLQLPKEWAAGPRLQPLSHNVYSYLPSLVESAYLHLGTMEPGSSEPVQRMLAGEGGWVIACQFLHALLALAGGLLLSRCAFIMGVRSGLLPDHAALRTISVATGALLVGTPWLIVTGSLAYNEAGVVCMLAGAALCAIDTSTPPVRRAIACALLTGVAAGCKPTALLLGAPTIGALLIAHLPLRKLAPSLAAGALAGLAALAPWLVRNLLAGGNPVFPFAAKLFGTAHWTTEQVERYARNHAPEATGLAALGRFLSSQFGLFHSQWSATLVLGFIAAGVASALAPTRRLGIALSIGLGVGTLAWMLTTHQQPRFLVPLAVPAVLAIALLGFGLIARALPTAHAPRSPRVRHMLVSGSVVITALAAATHSGFLFLTQGPPTAVGTPNALLIGGVGDLTGMLREDMLHRAGPEGTRAYLNEKAAPATFINLGLHPHDNPAISVYLLGDGAPLWILGAAPIPGAGRVVYHTTWDRSPLGDAIEASPNDPSAWSKHLRSLGLTHLVVNLSELSRLIDKDRYFDPRVARAGVERLLMDPASGLTFLRGWWSQGRSGAAGSSSPLPQGPPVIAVYALPGAPAIDLGAEGTR